MKNFLPLFILMAVSFSATAQITASFNTPRSTWCSNQEVRFNNSSTMADSFVWKFGNGETSNDRNPRYEYGETEQSIDTLDVWLIAYNSFGDVDSTFKTLYIQAAATADFRYKAVAIVCFFYPEATNFLGLSWDFGDGNTSLANADSITHVYPGSGTYTAQLIANTDYGCNDTTSKDIVIVDSAQGNSILEQSEYKLSLFPNPGGVNQTLSFELKNQENLNITVSDINGRILFEQSQNYQSGLHQISVGKALAAEPKGLYFVALDNGEKTYIIKTHKQ